MLKKLCKLCGVKSKYANTNFCYNCFKLREKLKKEEKAKKKLERKVLTKTYQEKLLKTVHNKTWKLMSEYIRKLHSFNGTHCICFTCGKVILISETHAGHFKHGRLDFDERNLKPQCCGCNTYNDGRLDVYALKLLKEYGADWLIKLEADSWQTPPYTVEQMLIIIEDLKIKIANLK
jgi:hypothetical protein